MPQNNLRLSLQESLSAIIKKIRLSDPTRQDFLEQRWLRRTLWYERMALLERRLYYFLRITTIVGAVTVPAIIGLNINEDRVRKEHLAWLAFGIGQTVAIAAALEEFIAPADKLRDYRQSSEDMQREGWHYLQLSGPYREFTTHDDAYKIFAERIEAIVEKNVTERLGLLEAQIAESTEVKAKENEKLAQVFSQTLEQLHQVRSELRDMKTASVERSTVEATHEETIHEVRREARVIVSAVSDIGDGPVRPNNGASEPHIPVETEAPSPKPSELVGLSNLRKTDAPKWEE